MKQKDDLIDRTTINDFNYIEQQRTTENYINLGADKPQQRNTTLFASSGLRPPIDSNCSSSVGGDAIALPDGVKSLKIDLFNNATDEDLLFDKSKYKLHMGIIKADGDKISVNASLSGPPRNYKRGIVNKNSEHYKLMEYIIENYRHMEDFRVSKFYQNANKQMITIQDWSVAVWRTEQSYQVKLVMGTDVMSIGLTPGKGLTKKQRQKNCIATWYQSVRNHPVIWGGDLLKSKK